VITALDIAELLGRVPSRRRFFTRQCLPRPESGSDFTPDLGRQRLSVQQGRTIVLSDAKIYHRRARR